jgi:hypothetical protein
MRREAQRGFLRTVTRGWTRLDAVSGSVALSLCVGSHRHLLSQQHIFYLARHELTPSMSTTHTHTHKAIFTQKVCVSVGLRVCVCGVQYTQLTVLRARVHAENTTAGRLNQSSPRDPSRGRAGGRQGSAGRSG